MKQVLSPHLTRLVKELGDDVFEDCLELVKDRIELVFQWRMHKKSKAKAEAINLKMKELFSVYWTDIDCPQAEETFGTCALAT